MAAPAAAKVESPTTRVVGIVLFSSLVGYVTYLCSWQLKRYEWKMALVQLRKERVTGEVRPLTEFVSAADLADVERAEQLAAVVGEEEFRRVAVRGEFDHAQQMLLGPRSAPPGAKQHGAPGGSPSGWDIVTPLRCEDGTVVLVNRGWVPRDSTVPARDPKTGAPNGHAFGVPAAFGQPRGAQEVHGVLKRGEQKNKYASPNPHPHPNPNAARRRREHVRPEHHSLCRHYSLCHTSPCRYAENKPEERRYVWLDLSTMASEGGSAPLLIVAAAQPGEHRKCSSHSECICKCSLPRRCGAPRHGKCSHKARHRKCSHKARLRKCSHSECGCDCDCDCSVPRLIVAAAQPRQAAADSRVAAPHLHGIQTGCIPAVRCITLRSYSLTHTRRAAVIIRVANDEAARVLPRLLRLPYHPLGAPCTRALHTRPAHAPSPLLHPYGVLCLAHDATRARDYHPSAENTTHTAAPPPLPNPPEPTCARTHLHHLCAPSVIRATGIRKHLGGAVGRRCIYDVQALPLMRAVRRWVMRVVSPVRVLCESAPPPSTRFNPHCNSS